MKIKPTLATAAAVACIPWLVLCEPQPLYLLSVEVVTNKSATLAFSNFKDVTNENGEVYSIADVEHKTWLTTNYSVGFFDGTNAVKLFEVKH